MRSIDISGVDSMPPCAACDHCVLAFSSGRTVRACSLVPGGVARRVDEVDGTLRTVVEQGAMCERARGTDACAFTCERTMRSRRRLLRAKWTCVALCFPSAAAALALLFLADGSPGAVVVLLTAVAVVCDLAAYVADRALEARSEPGALSLEERANMVHDWRSGRKSIS